MVRDFTDEPIGDDVAVRIMENALHAPSAGFSQGWAFLVLRTEDERGRFWDFVADPEWRAAPSTPGLLRAPMIVVPLSHRDAYLERYRQPDKAGARMQEAEDWPAPYWDID